MSIELNDKMVSQATRILDITWEHLLDLKEKLNGAKDWKTINYNLLSGFSLDVSEVDATCQISKNPIGKSDWEVKSFYRGQFHVGFKNENQTTKEFISRYLPIILLGSIWQNRPAVIVHMAQSLDGKVCTEAGNSKWIGNKENLFHAHRLRALVDGVLVGGNTLKNDLPKLNVRHVSGKNPKRVFLSNSFQEFNKLPEVEDAEVILIRNSTQTSTFDNRNITQLHYEGSTKEQQIVSILEQLRNRNINSLMIEGGPTTVSSFFKSGVVDCLQVHIAPKLFGSGKSMMSLPEIFEVSEGYSLENVQYDKVGDGLMVTCELNTKA